MRYEGHIRNGEAVPTTILFQSWTLLLLVILTSLIFCCAYYLQLSWKTETSNLEKN